MANDKKIHIVNLKFANIVENQKPKNGTEWISYDNDNLFPQRVAKYYDNSPTNQSIIKYKSDLTSGEGFMTSDEALNTFIAQKKLNHLLTKTSLDLNL
jgi:hypothetical protein